MRSRQKVIAALEKAMLADRGFEVPVVLMTPQSSARRLTSEAFAATSPGAASELQGHYLTLLAAPPTEEGAKALEARSEPAEEVQGRRASGAPDAEHQPYHEATTGNAEVERHLGVATTRT